jgi:transposase-like protein
MKAQIEIPETLHEAISYFSADDNAHNIIVSRRWPNGAECPHCESKEVTFMASRKVYQCRGCRKQFTVKVGTIFEDSPIKLDKWLTAFWLITNAKNGISSCELHRALGVTQTTAWFMLHRIRLAIQNGTIVKLGGTVEVDETFIGGKARNMHFKRRKKLGTTAGFAPNVTPVQGLLQRHSKCSKVVLKHVKTVTARELQGNVKEYVLKGSHVYSDSYQGYKALSKNPDFVHKFVDHAERYVDGIVHTNGLENFWSLLKRGIRGTYVSVEPFHLFRYLDEQAFRFNERTDTDQGRFLKAISNIFGKRLTFSELTGKNIPLDALPA